MTRMFRLFLVLGVAVGCGKKQDPPASKPQPQAATQTSEGIAENEEGTSYACNQCNVSGTTCEDDVCRLEARAFWRITPWMYTRAGDGHDEEQYRICIRPNGFESWACTKPISHAGARNGAKYLSASESVSLDVTTEELEKKGLDIEVRFVDVEDEEVIASRHDAVHTRIRAGELLFKGGLKYGINDGGFANVVVKFEPGDGAKRPNRARKAAPPPRPDAPPARTAPAGEKPIAAYRTRLGAADHKASDGFPLRTVGSILQQDRANYHRFKRPDSEDGADALFANAAERAKLGSAPIEVDDPSAILDGSPLVDVFVYRDDDGYRVKVNIVAR